MIEKCKEIIEKHKEEEYTVPEKDIWIIQAVQSWKKY